MGAGVARLRAAAVYRLGRGVRRLARGAGRNRQTLVSGVSGVPSTRECVAGAEQHRGPRGAARKGARSGDLRAHRGGQCGRSGTYCRALARYSGTSYSPANGSASRARKVANRDEAAAKKAGAARGGESSDADPKAASEEDRIAAAILRPARGPGLARVFRERELRF